jgi:hypothetical protein
MNEDSLSSALLKALTDFSSSKGADIDQNDDKKITTIDTVKSSPNLVHEVDDNIIVSVAVVEDIVDSTVIKDTKSPINVLDSERGVDGEDCRDLDAEHSSVENM